MSHANHAGTSPSQPAPARGYTLTGADNRPYRSATPGTLGGHRRGRRYGRLDCPSALRAIARGHYVGHRVFFADEATALAAGYRPCAVCLPRRYARWKHTSPRTEPAAVLRLVLALDPALVNVGHGRDSADVERANAFADAWHDLGGHLGTVVSWPSTAASWLRPATRLATGADMWVVADHPAGWAGIGPRLADTGRWRADRTVCFAGLADPALARTAGAPATDGLRGATADGGTWRITAGWLRTDPVVDGGG